MAKKIRNYPVPYYLYNVGTDTGGKKARNNTAIPTATASISESPGNQMTVTSANTATRRDNPCIHHRSGVLERNRLITFRRTGTIQSRRNRKSPRTPHATTTPVMSAPSLYRHLPLI